MKKPYRIMKTNDRVKSRINIIDLQKISDIMKLELKDSKLKVNKQLLWKNKTKYLNIKKK